MSRNKMFLRRSPESEGDEFNIWAAFTDLMSNSFLILSLLLIISLLKPTTCPPPPPPPTILLQDSGVIRFSSGKSGFDSENMFREFDKRDGIIDEIEKYSKLYSSNLVEIIGHTDPKPINVDKTQIVNINRNLDEKLLDTINDIGTDSVTNINTDKIVSGSNADLGLLRAVQIVRILLYHQKNNGRLQGLEFRAYSAAHSVPLKLLNDEDKRRIEIRFTRLNENSTIRI
ncbi:MAG: hypothetical protein WCP16_01595 [Pseudanabaena sp. ELA645]|jgi:hypothetical protein